ncbi:hypothetical protein V8D89_006771 [Ganoderma adspersum]
MSAAASDTGAIISVIAAEAAALDGAMDFLLLTTICTGILIPISIALFLSFSRIWRTPVFLFNVFAIALGFAYGGLTITYLKMVFSGRLSNPRLTLVFMCMSFLIPVCVQSILIIRVVMVYPPCMLSWGRNLLIYGIFIALSIARIVNMALFLNNVSRDINQSHANSTAISFYALRRGNGKAEWIMQSVNDLYASMLFLLQVKNSRAFKSKEGALASVFTNGGVVRSYSARLKALFWIAVFNFVFPVILNIVIVIFTFREPNLLHTVDVITLNIYFEIVCVLLATVWCTGTYWENATVPSLASDKHVALEGGEVQTTESLDSAKFATRSVADSVFVTSHV